MTENFKHFIAPRLVLAAAAITVLAGPVASQQVSTAQRNAIRAACRSDYEAHCMSVPPGGKPAFMCLQKNMESLSRKCQQAVGAVGKKSSAPAVRPKASKTPAAAAASPEQAPSAETSKAATATVQTPRPSSAQIDAIRQACRVDYQSSCAGVPTGGAAALSCLQKNAANLSQPCQQAVSAASSGSGPTETAITTAPASRPATTGAAASPPMRAVSLRQEIVIARSSCSRDVRSHCSGVQPGGGRLVGCLRANATSLSPRCQNALIGLRQSR